MEYNYASFDAFAAAKDVESVSAIENPTAANQVIETLFADEPMPEPPEPAPAYTTLPVGLRRNGQVHRDARVRELTGADEEEIARSGSDPLRYFEAILKAGAVAVGPYTVDEELLGELTIADRDTLVLAIRIATFGDTLEWIGYECPSCHDLSDLKIPLNEIEIREVPADLEPEFFVTLREGLAMMRLPTGADQRELFTREDLNPAERNSVMLGRCLVEVTYGPDGRSAPTLEGSVELVRSMGMADRRLLLDALDTHAYGPVFERYTIIHEPCGQEVRVPINVGALFR